MAKPVDDHVPSEKHGAQEDGAICRVCLSAEGADADDRLIQPCQCRGSQAWVHKLCLERWQNSVQVGSISNHPRDVDREERHMVCNVCKARFNVAPPSRKSVMESLAGISVSSIKPGLLLVSATKEDEEEASRSPAGGGDVVMLLRVLMEAKHKHFKNAVYFVTEEMEHHNSRGNNIEDAVLAVNLVRPVESQTESLEGALGCSAADQRDLLRSGVELKLFYGGPVNTKTIVAMCFVPSSARVAFGGSLRVILELAEGLTVPHELVVGPVLQVVRLATEVAKDSAGTALVSESCFAGYALWSKTQLLGEIARGKN
eukprot:TRINITY_DN7997_c0_g1_i1.p1 TRINITY_DN7997_c0_g1~~TRINITY_DN7997_c0_g1_i1.p1  ORF type:complete len:326 (+),score=49.88 TRINITY_DN7997_c0_g1_i1:34-978(+)